MNRETRKSPRPPCPDCEGGRADAPLCDRCAEAYQKAEREAERLSDGRLTDPDDIAEVRRQLEIASGFLQDCGRRLHGDALYYAGEFPANEPEYHPAKWGAFGRDGQINNPIYRVWESAVDALRSDDAGLAVQAEKLPIADLLAWSKTYWLPEGEVA